jgi:hypothetical protein
MASQKKVPNAERKFQIAARSPEFGKKESSKFRGARPVLPNCEIEESTT